MGKRKRKRERRDDREEGRSREDPDAASAPDSAANSRILKSRRESPHAGLTDDADSAENV